MHPRCYAGVSEDCSTKLSSEHWLSADILRASSGEQPVIVSGMPWQADAEHALSVKALGSKVLCERHNRALSPLDRLAGQVFRVVHHYQIDQREIADPHGHEFALFSGDVFERWMLKLLWGGVAARALGRREAPAPSLRSAIDARWLSDVLFRNEPMPEPLGFYMAGRPDVPFSGEAAVGIEPLVGPQGDVWGAGIEFGAITFRLYLGTPGHSDDDVTFHRHPQGFFLSKASRDVQKVLAFAWNDGGSPPVSLTRIADGSTGRRPSQL